MLQWYQLASRVLEYTGVIQKQRLSNSLTQTLAEIFITRINPQRPRQSCARGGTQGRRLLCALTIVPYVGPTHVAPCRLSTLRRGSWLNRGSTGSSAEKREQLTATRHGATLAFNPWERGWVCIPATWLSPLRGTELVLPPQPSSNAAGRRALLLKFPCGE